MPGPRTLAVTLAVLVWPVTVYAGTQADRSRLLAALEERAATGTPAHLDHDAGEELQAMVRGALAGAPDDAELVWAAVRGSIALVPEVNPPITDGAPPAAWVEVRAPFELPWRVSVSGTFDVSLDGSPWQEAANLQAAQATSIQIPIDRIFRKRANRPGFHVLRVRVALRFAGLPSGVPTAETRDLATRTYAVEGSSRGGVQAAAFLRSAAQASVSALDPLLPQTPFTDWLRYQLPPTITVSDVHWTSRWCETRADADDNTRASVCAVAQIASPPGGHAEVWIRTASVDMSGAKPSWTADGPTLEGIDLLRLPMRSSVPLHDLPFAIQDESWPRMSVTLAASDIDVAPAAPGPGEPVRVRLTVRNTGDAPVYGMTLDVMSFDTPERMLQHRRFVRTIPAGGSVTVETATMFPLGYGGLLVSAMPLSQDTVLGVPMTPDDSTGFTHAGRLIRPDLAPRGYADAVRASIGCTAQCANIR